MTTPPRPEDLLSPSGKSWSPQDIGDKIVGIITAQVTQQQTEPGPERKLRTYKDGSPMWQIVFTLQTELRDPEVDDDDGVRRVFAAYELQKALKEALKAAGVKSTAVGGKLMAVVSGTHKNPYGGKPVKEYKARYKAPDPVADVLETEYQDDAGAEDDGFDDTPAPPAPRPRKAPAKKAAPAAAAAVEDYLADPAF